MQSRVARQQALELGIRGKSRHVWLRSPLRSPRAVLLWRRISSCLLGVLLRFGFVLSFVWFVAFDGAVSQLAGRALVF